MSPRAAWRLEALGFDSVYDYVLGKVDWLAAGKATEGPGPAESRVLSAVTEALTCAPTDSLADVVATMDRTGTDLCIVVNGHGVVEGRLRRDKVGDAAEGRVDAAMEVGPATVRAHESLEETRQRMRSRHVASIIVSTPEGVLLGVVRADDDRAAASADS